MAARSNSSIPIRHTIVVLLAIVERPADVSFKSKRASDRTWREVSRASPGRLFDRPRSKVARKHHLVDEKGRARNMDLLLSALIEAVELPLPVETPY